MKGFQPIHLAAHKKRRPVCPWPTQEDGHDVSPQQPAKRPLLLLEDVTAKVRRLRQLGCRYADDGHFRRAVGAFAEALQFDPANATLLEMQAQAHMELCEFFEAVQCAASATVAFPNWFAGKQTQMSGGQLLLGSSALVL